MPADTLAALKARLEATPVERPQARSLGTLPLPQALAATRLRPRRWLSPGFWIAPVREGYRDGWRTYLLRAPAGQKLPEHRHDGPELVCVLEGAYNDGEIHRCGDFVESPRLSSHVMTVTDDGPCTCLVAAKGRLNWDGLAGAVGSVALY